MRCARRVALAVAAGTVLAVGAAGCVAVPSGGPVVEVDSAEQDLDEQASARDGLPPTQGATTVEVVSGFLDAMQSWPIDVGLARQYLDEDSASTWNPEAATITFADNLPPQDRGNRVSVQLSGAARIDARGAWQGPLGRAAQSLRFDLVLEDGEYRISDPPDSLVVPAAWFEERYRQVSLYFFDPTGRILVPEPVFVPRGQQLVTTLVERLLAGPPPSPRGLTRTYLPPGLSSGLSVTVSADGLADITLSGGQLPQSEDAVDHLLAQLAWTLRQEPAVGSLRLTVGDTPMPLPDGGAEYPVDGAREFDPTGYQADAGLWGLADGLLVRGGSGGFDAAPGPWGTEVAGVRSVTVDLDARTVAGVSADGGTLLTAPVGDVPPRRRATTTVVAGATDLLRPHWDASGRLWAVDRTTDGARVLHVEDGRVRELDVPGITGADVRAVLVSRDATRIVAAVRRGGLDEVRAARVVVDARGRVVRATTSTVIAAGSPEVVRVRDLGWTSPTTVAVLEEVDAGDVYEVTTVPVDGAPATVESPISTTLSGTVRGLATSPVLGSALYALTDTGVADLGAGTTTTLPEPVRSVAYVG